MKTAADVVQTATVGALLHPVTGGNPFEETVGRLAHAIKLGLVPPGGRLPPERELSARLGVSRVTLRGAIRALQQAGYIESKRGRNGGSFVIWDGKATNPRDARSIALGMGGQLLDQIRYRMALEPGAAYLAAQAQLTAVQRAAIARAAEEVRAAAPDTYRTADVRLHLAIADAAGSPSLAAAIADVQMAISDLLAAIPRLPEALEHSQAQHDRIVRAVLAGDAEGARMAMTDHLAATATLLEGFLG